MFSLQVADKVSMVINDDEWPPRIGTVTEIDDEEFIYISIDREPGRAKFRIKEGKVAGFFTNFSFKKARSGSHYTSKHTLEPHANKDCVTHHPKAIICSQQWSKIRCIKCKYICCNICNLCKMEDCNQYCYQCINNDDLFDKYRINKVLCSFCNIGINGDNKNNLCKECGSRFCENCGAESIHSCLKCNEYNLKQRYFASINECLLEIINKYLIDIIISYCIGYIVECNNIKCSNMISINNDIDLSNNIDSFGSEIYKYYIEEKYIHICSYMIGRKVMHKLQGKYLRIFCSECRESQLFRCNRDICKWRWCSNPCWCNNYDSNESCLNHAFCGQYLNNYWTLICHENDIKPKCKYHDNIYQHRGIEYCYICKTDFDEVCKILDIHDVDDFYRYSDYKQKTMSKAKKRRLRKRKLKQNKQIRSESLII